MRIRNSSEDPGCHSWSVFNVDHDHLLLVNSEPGSFEGLPCLRHILCQHVKDPLELSATAKASVEAAGNSPEPDARSPGWRE